MIVAVGADARHNPLKVTIAKIVANGPMIVTCCTKSSSEGHDVSTALVAYYRIVQPQLSSRQGSQLHHGYRTESGKESSRLVVFPALPRVIGPLWHISYLRPSSDTYPPFAVEYRGYIHTGPDLDTKKETPILSVLCKQPKSES